MIVVDAHEDLAWNGLTFGRDYLQSVSVTRAREAGTTIPERNGETLIGWPEWIAGGVAVVFATLFAAPARSKMGTWETNCYADAEQAHALYRAQLDWYHQLVAAHPTQVCLLRSRADLAAHLESWQHGEPQRRRVGFVLLMEGADGVRQPLEIAEWAAGGIRIVGPAWARTQYVGGTGDPGPFTEAGRALLREMAAAGLVLDISHLSDEALPEAFDLYGGPLIASHCNARALLPKRRQPERHLTDSAIRTIAAREGVIGIVPFNAFLRSGWTRQDPRDAVTLADVVAHIDHMSQLVGDTQHIGLGSDFDGGFGLGQVPIGLDSVADLPRIGDALAARGYTTPQIEGILGGNWLRFLEQRGLE